MTSVCEAGCGRRVSGNKRFCMTCIETRAQALIEAREKEPMDKATHIIMRFPSQNREDLYRADNGMLVASRQSECVRFGIEPKEAGNRLFLNAEFAALWLRTLPGAEIVTRTSRLTLADVIDRHPDEAKSEEFVIEERDAESVILMPLGSPVQVLKN